MTYDWLWFAAIAVICLSAAVSGILIFALSGLRKDIDTFAAMVNWKWTEAPWWTRADSDLHATLANQVRNRAGQCRCCRCMACQFGENQKENRPEDPGSISRDPDAGHW